MATKLGQHVTGVRFVNLQQKLVKIICGFLVNSNLLCDCHGNHTGIFNPSFDHLPGGIFGLMIYRCNVLRRAWQIRPLNLFALLPGTELHIFTG